MNQVTFYFSSVPGQCSARDSRGHFADRAAIVQIAPRVAFTGGHRPEVGSRSKNSSQPRAFGVHSGTPEIGTEQCA